MLVVVECKCLVWRRETYTYIVERTIRCAYTVYIGFHVENLNLKYQCGIKPFMPLTLLT